MIILSPHKTHSLLNSILASLLAIIISGLTPLAAPSRAAQGQPISDDSATSASYLELSVRLAIVLPGTLVIAETL